MSATQEDKTYNGWTNYETWVVKLWMDNDPITQTYWDEQAREAREHPIKNQYMTLDRRQVHALVEKLKAYHEEQAEQFLADQASVFADLLNAGLGGVNWYEIAESLLNDLEEED